MVTPAFIRLMVAPQYYFNENELTESQYDDKTTYSKLNGGGVDVSLRYYLKKDNQIPRGFYTSFIVSYQNFNLEFPEYKWMKYTRNGLEYIDYSLVDEKVTINRMNAGVTIGFMATISGVAFFDFYIGYGGRKSDLKTRSGIETEKFQERIWDYGYSGINMLLGMRIGLMF